MISLVLGIVFSIVGAVAALRARHLMRGVLGLAVFFVGLAILFGLLGAWYLAVGQLFLFVGGVVTLFVLAFNFTKTPVQASGKIAGMLIAALFVGSLGMLIPQMELSGVTVSLSEFATLFFSQYGWVLNATFLLLFSAILGAQYLVEVKR